jgi:hypothetical protein
MVAQLRPDGGATYWLTGTSAPCLSLFKPFSLEGFLSDAAPALRAALGPEPGAQDDGGRSLWWEGERLHRAVIRDYPARSSAFLPDLARLQADFLHRTAEMERSGDVGANQSVGFLEEARRAASEWTARVNAVAPRRAPLSFYQRSWRSQNVPAGLSSL